MDATHAAKAYGWRHQTSLEEGLTWTWEWINRGMH